MGAGITIEARGKTNQNNFARSTQINNLSKYDLKGVTLKIKSSKHFQGATVADLEVGAGDFKEVELPHTPRPGHELAEKDTIEYALMRGKKEICTTTAEVWLKDHSRFAIEAEKAEAEDFTKCFTRKFIIRNDSSVTLPYAVLAISGSACFQPAQTDVGEVKAGEWTTVTVQHRLVNNRINLETIEEFTSYSLRYEGVELTEFKRQARMYEYSGIFRNYMPPAGSPPLRVIFSGQGGTGKSSMIDSAFTAFSPDDKVMRGVTAISPLAGHGTTDFQLYALLPFLHLADPWGHQPQNYANGELLKMLDGTMQVGSHMSNPVEEKEENNRIHAIVLFVPAGSTGFDCEKEIVKQALKKKLNATIVMAQCDHQLSQNEVSRFRSNPNKLLPALEARRLLITENVGTGAVIQGAPYVANETSKIFERDRLTMRILEFALASGLNFQRFHTTPQI